jgi:hypothetical protein
MAQRHIALLPAMEVGIDAQVHQVLPLAFGLCLAGGCVEELAQRVGHFRRDLFHLFARRHTACAQSREWGCQQVKKSVGDALQRVPRELDIVVRDVVASNKHAAACVDAAANMRAARGVKDVACRRIAIGHWISASLSGDGRCKGRRSAASVQRSLIVTWAKG